MNRCGRDGSVPVASRVREAEETSGALDPREAERPVAALKDGETFAVDIRQAAMPYFSDKAAAFVRDHASVRGVAVDRQRPTPLGVSRLV